MLVPLPEMTLPVPAEEPPMTLSALTMATPEFELPSATSPFTFPSVANATLARKLGNKGLSGVLIDNVSAAVGASQIYFGDRQNRTGVQASQAALQ